MNGETELLKSFESIETFWRILSVFTVGLPWIIGIIIILYCISKDRKRRRNKKKNNKRWIQELNVDTEQKASVIQPNSTDVIFNELDEVEEKARHENPEVTREEYERIVSSETGILEIDTMGGEKFENFLKHYFQGEYTVQKTSVFADYGADLLLQNKDGKVEAVVQAKRHLSKITVTAVYETLGGMAYYGAKKGIVVTNNEFTQNAINLAEKGNIELWNRDTLIERITRDNLQLIKRGDEEFRDNAYLRTCPVCKEGILWRKRNHKTGKEFYGCSRYKEYGCEFTDGLNKAAVKRFLNIDKKKKKCSICGNYIKVICWKGGRLGVCSSGQYHDKIPVWFPDDKKYK